jgi:predicted nucleic acid-binding protein
MSDRTFVDTNVLIYGHDRTAGRKYTISAALLEELWATGAGVISIQVLQEFYVNITKKIPVPIPKARAAIYVGRYFLWPVVSPAPSTVLRALEFEKRHQISFWDAMILSAALQAGVRKLVSEDLNAGHTIEGIRIENPFA